METIKKFFTTQPLLAGIIVLALLVAIWLAGSTLWDLGRLAWLESANVELVEDKKKLEAEKTELEKKNAVSEDRILNYEHDLEQANALLQATSQNAVKSQQNLDSALDTATRIMGDDSPIERAALEQKLCSLYNIPPAACK